MFDSRQGGSVRNGMLKIFRRYEEKQMNLHKIFFGRGKNQKIFITFDLFWNMLVNFLYVFGSIITRANIFLLIHILLT